ncbi:hypothetical protein B0H11DRAFT_1765721 [Mycena galericulata]|nr:hypothetical protein B0H11DRAFT_1765721 [Mycena galericulata]
MERLLRRGIAFLVCFRSDQVPTGKPLGRNWYSGLGFRPKGYTPDLSDYNAYITLSTQFLLSPRGRAAMLYGGDVGRLARAVVLPEDVFRGPSDDATIDGICLYDGHAQYAYWDDGLTEQELDLICGVYHVSTGFAVSGEQTTTRSWWPRPSAWESSALNVGWWTPSCEAWFQKRLETLQAGTGTLVSHADWRHNLKLERKCGTYVDATERCAASMLAVLRP